MKIIAKDKYHLKRLIEQEIELKGNQCDLNHIDISKVNNMSYMFAESQFNQDLSKWKLLALLEKVDIFENSTLEKNHKLPYWADIEPVFMKSTIELYWLNKKLQKTLPDNNQQKSLIKV